MCCLKHTFSVTISSPTVSSKLQTSDYTLICKVLPVSEINKKLSLDDATDIDSRLQQKTDIISMDEVAHKKMAEINDDTSETIDSLNHIQSRIKEHKTRMKRIGNLDDIFSF